MCVCIWMFLLVLSAVVLSRRTSLLTFGIIFTFAPAKYSSTYIDQMSLAEQVQKNLLYQHLWNGVCTFDLTLKNGESVTLCRGTPPEKLHPDDSGALEEEYILPVETEAKWTISQWNDVFEQLTNLNDGEFVRRVVMAMVTLDSTIVFYFVNNGLTKPRKN